MEMLFAFGCGVVAGAVVILAWEILAMRSRRQQLRERSPRWWIEEEKDDARPR